MKRIRRIASDIAEFFYPSDANCLGCGDAAGTDGDWLCDECAKALLALLCADRHTCERCGVPLQMGASCPFCRFWPSNGLRAARFAYGYATPASNLVRKMKYQSTYKIADWMGRQIATVVSMGIFGPVDALVPVPMHPNRLHDRGHNHALLLANAASEATSLPVWDVLLRTKNTKLQARASVQNRRSSMDGAFALRADAHMLLKDKNIVLIDDVITTGTTANACAKILRTGGAKDVCAAAFAGHMPHTEDIDEDIDVPLIHNV